MITTFTWFFADARTIVGPPISTISNKSKSAKGGWVAAASLNGYRLQATTSIIGYPNSDKPAASFSFSSLHSRGP